MKKLEKAKALISLIVASIFASTIIIASLGTLVYLVFTDMNSTLKAYNIEYIYCTQDDSKVEISQLSSEDKYCEECGTSRDVSGVIQKYPYCKNCFKHIENDYEYQRYCTKCGGDIVSGEKVALCDTDISFSEVITKSDISEPLIFMVMIFILLFLTVIGVALFKFSKDVYDGECEKIANMT